MRKLRINQKNIIKKYAKSNYLKGDTYMFLEAYKMDIYDELNKIHCFENMDSAIEDVYGKEMIKLTR